jgi:hypothetical protein
VEQSTVKTHLINLYRKLGVNTRTQAIVRARALQLLEESAPGRPFGARVTAARGYPGAGSVDGFNERPDVDVSVRERVGTETSAVDEATQYPRSSAAAVGTLVALRVRASVGALA